MQEIHCKQCGEPWSVYALRNDVPDWDSEPDNAYEKVMSGDGCPTCDWGEKAGEVSVSRTTPEEELTQQHFQDVFHNTDDDPVKYL